MSERFAVDGIWLGAARGPAALELGWDAPAAPGRLRLLQAAPAKLPRLALTVLPALTDHHVHLGLVERELLADGPLAEVHDLGWVLEEALAWRARPPRGLTVKVAGPFHTAPGGYPSGRYWAPAAAVRALADAADARAAVADAAAAGVDAIKIALHSGMPLLGDEPLQALVRAAHAAGLPAIVHAEGPGQAARAIDAGADVLVHTPWSEPLSDAVLRRALSTTWISTLAIHDAPGRAVATENLRRFRALGGRIRYGTDMGNGPTPVGPSAPELTALAQAGLSVDELIAAMTEPGLEQNGLRADRVLVCERPLPASCEELVAWLDDCRRVSAEELLELR